MFDHLYTFWLGGGGGAQKKRVVKKTRQYLLGCVHVNHEFWRKPFGAAEISKKKKNSWTIRKYGLKIGFFPQKPHQIEWIAASLKRQKNRAVRIHDRHTTCVCCSSSGYFRIWISGTDMANIFTSKYEGNFSKPSWIFMIFVDLSMRISLAAGQV